MPGQPSNGLMPERVRRGFDAGRLGVALDDLLNPSGREGTSKPGSRTFCGCAQNLNIECFADYLD
jgi:hypothetical protein